ncbi:MAG: hypothetical protein Q8R28_08145, partial [Dehalococcoidia bacterium]|nr:hypothetical protein [Dehalococcoidia bacterium]
MADAKQGFLRDFYDRNFPLKELEQETGIPAHKLAQVVPGATAAGEDIIRRVYRPILERVTDDIPFLEEYMVLRRNEDILARNPEALLPGGVHGLQGTLEALGTLERRLGEGRFRAVQEAADALWRANDEHVLGPLLNEGILSREQYTAIASANRHYIPWQRADYADVFENAMTRPEASVSSTGLVRLTEEGSTRKLDNPLARLEAQVIKTQRVLSRNRAAKGIAEALYDMERRTGEKVIEFVDPQMARAQRGTARTAETGARFVAEGESSAAKETISWFENGQKRTAVVPSIYGHVAKNLDAEPNNV